MQCPEAVVQVYAAMHQSRFAPDSFASSVWRIACTVTLAWVVLAPGASAQTAGTGEDFPEFGDLMDKAGKRSRGRIERRLEALESENRLEKDSESVGGVREDGLLPPISGGSRAPQFNPVSQPRTEPPFDDITDRLPRFDPNALPAEQDGEFAPDLVPDLDPQFEWTEHFVSAADVRFPKVPDSDFRTSELFEHGEAFLTIAEESAYLDMLDAIASQRRALVARAANDLKNSAASRAEWEKAFYEYERARRLAWDNGHLRPTPGEDKIGGLPNPFGTEGKPSNGTEEGYSLLNDVNRFPEHFVGRPVVLQGLFRPGEIIRIGRDQPDSGGFGAEPLHAGKRPEVPVLQGTLSTFSGDRQIALVHTGGLLTPQKGLLTIQNGPTRDEVIPVLVKGWVVKKWDSGPLVYCEAVRQISPIPHFELIRQYTVDGRRIHGSEEWLYYETLRQLELTSSKLQKATAASVLQQRIGQLMLEIEEQTQRDLKRSRELQQAGKLAESELRQRESALKLRLKHRVARYRQFREEPTKFQTYVDMFQYPDVYHGHLVTLHGHVRHAVSYPGDPTLFDGRQLHELWLFTDDSQHNPAVIVTPNLPADFPLDAEVVDHVSVTGCFFKRYVYGSQDTDRIAPLVLAGSLEWTPTAAHVQELVAEGHLSARSPRAVKAAAMSQGLSRTAAMVIGFFIILTIMILWGRAQREESDRVRLRRRVNEIPEFENQSTPGYSLPSIDTAVSGTSGDAV